MNKFATKTLGCFIFLFLTNQLVAQKTINTAKLFRECGGVYWPDKQALTKGMKPYFDAIKFRGGDTIASIGARSMTPEMAFSTVVDSLSFVLESIDSTCLNKRHFNDVKAYYSTIGATPVTNKFTLKIGTERETKLGSNSFHKVLILSSLHEFTYTREMMTDIKRILKGNGLLYISETVPRFPGQLHGGCNRPMLTESDVRKLVEPHGFVLINTTVLGYTDTVPNNFLYTFSQKQ